MEKEVKELKGKTVGELLSSLTDMVEDGKYPTSTITPLKIAVGKIMRETSPAGDWRNSYIDDVDLDARIETFRKKTLGACSGDTIYTYKTRFERAIKIFARELRARRRRQEAMLFTPREAPSVAFEGFQRATPYFYEDPRTRKRLLIKCPESTSSVAQDAQKDYTAYVKKNLLKTMNEVRFEEDNMIYPIIVGQDCEAFLILPKELSSKERKKVSDKLKVALKLTKMKENGYD